MSGAVGTLSDPRQHSRRRPVHARAVLLPILLFVVVFLGQWASTDNMIADSSRSVYVASELVHHGDINLTRYTTDFGGDHSALTVKGQELLPLFPWAPDVTAVPMVVGYDVLRHIEGGPSFDARFAKTASTINIQVVSMAWVVGLTAVILFFVSRRLLWRLEERRRTWCSLGVALVFAFCTSAWTTAGRSLWQQGPSMLCLSLAVLFALRIDERRRNLIWLGAALAGSYLMRPTDAVAIVAFSVWVLWRYRQGVVLYLAGAAPLAALFVFVSETTYGSFQPPYYRPGRLGAPQDGYQVHFPQALAGNLVSPGRGVFIFMPFFVFAIVGVVMKVRSRELTGLDAVLVASIVLQWIAISLFPQWWGGDSYGPRFFSDMVPFFMLLCLPVVQRLATPSWEWSRPVTRPRMTFAVSVLVVGGFLIHFQGAMLTSAWCWNEIPAHVDSHTSRLWDWTNPQFLAGFRGLWDGVPHDFARDGVLTYGCPPGSAPL